MQGKRTLTLDNTQIVTFEQFVPQMFHDSLCCGPALPDSQKGFTMSGIGMFLFAAVAAFGTAVMVARVILNGLFWLVLNRRRSS